MQQKGEESGVRRGVGRTGARIDRSQPSGIASLSRKLPNIEIQGGRTTCIREEERGRGLQCHRLEFHVPSLLNMPSTLCQTRLNMSGIELTNRVYQELRYMLA